MVPHKADKKGCPRRKAGSMPPRKVVVSEEIRKSRYFDLTGRLLRLMVQLRQEEYPNDPDSLGRSVQLSIEGIFPADWLHPLHFLLFKDFAVLYREFLELERSSPKLLGIPWLGPKR